jgi:hypothetical protein
MRSLLSTALLATCALATAPAFVACGAPPDDPVQLEARYGAPVDLNVTGMT